MRGKGRRKKEEGRKKQGEWRIRRGKSKAQLALAGAKALRICGGRRSGRLAGHALLGAVLPNSNELVGTKEQHGTDRRLVEPAGLEGGWRRRLGHLEITRRQVNLSQAPIRQGDVDLHKEEEARQRAALPEPDLGPLGLGDRAPNNALLLGESAPTGGDGAESPADRDLGGGVRGLNGMKAG